VYDAMARNLLRLVDSIPGFYAVGVVCALLSRQSRRLGDYVAGTVVIREKQSEWYKGVSFPEGSSSIHLPMAAPNLSRMTLEEFKLAETFLLRRAQLPADIRRKLGQQIADRIAASLRLPSDASVPAESLLELVVTEYRDQARQ
jgi:hypothetical protein